MIYLKVNQTYNTRKKYEFYDINFLKEIYQLCTMISAV